MIYLSFCNDCDRMEWNDFTMIHSLFDELGIPAGDSFWLFDPVGLSDFSLFRNSVKEKSRNHDRVLEQIRAGRLDVLHGIGLFGRTGDDYEYPDRDEIRRALDFLDSHGCRIRTYVCHGNEKHRHNIPSRPDMRRYQSGDLPFSKFYVLDILKEYGFRYFWISELQQDLNLPFRIMRQVAMPSGETINVFKRFGIWGCGSHDIPGMLAADTLGRASAMRQNLVFFTHWGMRGKHTTLTDAPLYHRGVTASLASLADLQNQGKVRVLPLAQLLEMELGKTLSQEADRMEGMVSGPEGDAALPAESYAGLVRELGLAGDMALDATGEQGRLGLHLADRFRQVHCLDRDQPSALKAGFLSTSLGVPNMFSQQGGIASLNMEPRSLDAVFLRSSFLGTGNTVLGRVYEALAPGRTLCLFMDSPLTPPRVLETACRAVGFRTIEWQENEQGAVSRDIPLHRLGRFFASR